MAFQWIFFSRLKKTQNYHKIFWLNWKIPTYSCAFLWSTSTEQTWKLIFSPGNSNSSSSLVRTSELGRFPPLVCSSQWGVWVLLKHLCETGQKLGHPWQTEIHYPRLCSTAAQLWALQIGRCRSSQPPKATIAADVFPSTLVEAGTNNL